MSVVTLHAAAASSIPGNNDFGLSTANVLSIDGVYVQASPGGLPAGVEKDLIQLYTLNDDGSLPANAIISKVQTFINAAYIADNTKAPDGWQDLILKTGFALQVGAGSGLGTSYATTAGFGWTTDPYTSAAWTRAAVFSFLFGFQVTYFAPFGGFVGDTASVDMFRTDVTYTVPPDPVTYSGDIDSGMSVTTAFSGSSFADFASELSSIFDVDVDIDPSGAGRAGADLVLDVPGTLVAPPGRGPGAGSGPESGTTWRIQGIDIKARKEEKK